MSINDGQIRIIESSRGDVIIIDIDLHFKDGQKMYFVAIENQKEHVQQMKWRIISFLTKQGVMGMFPDVPADYLPKSSRTKAEFQKELNYVPSANVLLNVLAEINSRKLQKIPKKYPRKDDKQRTTPQKRMPISVRGFSSKCRQQIESGNYVLIPVVVVKGKQTWIEWKVPINIFGDEYMCISLKYNQGSRRWTIACLDFDAGCIYYKHRLIGSDAAFSYEELKKYCTISLDFEKSSLR